MSDEPPILLSAVEERIYKVTLNRPAKRNALNREARAALLDALEESRDKASVIILAGAGGGMFCAGMDLNQLNTGGRADEDELNDSWRLVQEQIRRGICLHPVIASAQGYALGGGSTLINTCDLAVVAEDVQIGMPEIGFLLPGAGLGRPCSRRLSAKRAAWMVLTAKRIDGRTAVEWGMANVAVPAAQLEDATLELARHVAGFDAVALEWSKKALWQIPMHIGEWRAALEFGAYVNAVIGTPRTPCSHTAALENFIEGRPNPGQGAGIMTPVPAGAPLRVAEIARGVAGSVCGRLFAALGHDVVGSQGKGGDPARSRPPLNSGGTGLSFVALNADKRSVVADTADDVAALLDGADVLILDLTPVEAAALDLTPERLRASWPRLVVSWITAFGRDGDYSELPGDSLLAEAYSAASPP